MIFATTTPVPEKSNGRKAGDAERYNAVALDVMKKHPSIIINDLFTLTKPMQSKWWTRPGNVHFNEKGYTAQGDQVAKHVEEALAK